MNSLKNEKIDDIETKFKEYKNTFNQIIINDLGKFVENIKNIYNQLKERCIKEFKFINYLLKTSKKRN